MAQVDQDIDFSKLPTKKNRDPEIDFSKLPTKKEASPAPAVKEEPSLGRRIWDWGTTGLMGHEPSMEEWQKSPAYAAKQAGAYYMTSPLGLLGEALPVVGGIRALRGMKAASKGVSELGNIAHDVAPAKTALKETLPEVATAEREAFLTPEGTVNPNFKFQPDAPVKPDFGGMTAEQQLEENARKMMGVTEKGKIVKEKGALSGKPRGRPKKIKPEGPNVVTDERLKQVLDDPTVSPLDKIDSIKKWEAFTGRKYSGPNIPPEPPVPPPGGGSGGNMPPGMPDEQPGKISQLLNTPKQLWATFDMSAPLRQGFPLMVSHNKEWRESLWPMIKSFKNEQNYQELMQSIIDHPLYKRAIGDGLQITDLRKLSRREENFLAPWLEKFPGIRASNRAYTAFLDKLRMDTYNSLYTKALKTGLDPENNKALSSAMANFVNNATGRGNLGSFEDAATSLNTFFFSPRLIASRLQMMNPVNYISAPPLVRKEYWKAMAGTVSAWGTVATLAALGGAKVSMDPTNSDFGKIRIGNTRIDPGAGFLQYAVAMTRLGQMPLQYALGRQGYTTSSLTGRTKKLNTGRFGEPTYFDIGERFVESKLAPWAQNVIAMAHGTDYAGNKTNVPAEAIDLFIPLIIQDAVETYNTDPDLVPYTIPASFFGMGTQSYGKTEGDITLGKLAADQFGLSKPY